MAWFDRLKQGLAKTRQTVRGSLDRLVRGGPDPSVLEELETSLIMADLGVRTVDRVIEQLRKQAHGMGWSGAQGGERSLALLKDTLLSQLRACEGLPIETLMQHASRPFTMLTVGVNGGGKTTLVAKLAQRLLRAGKKPLLVAADTFRAAASDQLEVWGSRIGADVIRHQQGADPSAVVFDGVAAAKGRGVDAVLIDTAGRLHTKTNLMEELRKMRRVLERELPGAPHEVLLVLDAAIGQNALAQARQFYEAVGVTGLALNKLDGTARGGIVVAIADELKLPIRLLGVGEGVDDLQDFRAQDFVDALLAQPT